MTSDPNAICNVPNAAAAVDLRTEGWDGLFAATVRTFSNITTTFRMYFDPDYQYYPSTWRPEEWERASRSEIDERGSGRPGSGTPQDGMENMLCVPVYNTKDNYLVRDNTMMWVLVSGVQGPNAGLILPGAPDKSEKSVLLGG
jgi:hypothetical protein